MDEKFLYELFSNGTDIPGYYRLKRCLSVFETIKTDVKSVLDAGCGRGTKSIYLARSDPTLKVVGADMDRNSVDSAKALKEKYHLSNVSFHQRDLVNAPDLGNFDFVIVSDVLEHIENDRQSAANIDKMLKPGGYLHVSAPSKEHDYDFSKLSPSEAEDLRKWMKDVGHVRLGYTFDEIKSLFPTYDICSMKKVGNCCNKIAFFFWEKAVFDPGRMTRDETTIHYKFPFINYVDSLIHNCFTTKSNDIDSVTPSVSERMFLQAIRTIDIGMEMEDKGLLGKRYLVEEEMCGLLKKPVSL